MHDFSRFLVLTFLSVVFLTACSDDTTDPEIEKMDLKDTGLKDDENTAFSLSLEDDVFTTIENEPVTLDLYSNDGEIPSDAKISNTDPKNGVLVNGNTIIYTPNDGFVGEDNFTYEICDPDNSGVCFSASVKITVIAAGGIIDEFSTELKAFPTAYGAGAYSTGGRGGNVYHVTSVLDDGTEGTLRWALAQPRPATVIFDVAGFIDLSDFLNLSGDNLTIAGQTAPEGGITISSKLKRRIRGYQGATNHVIRYLRIRQPQGGDDAYEYFSDGREMNNLIMDHISISYGGDEALSVRGGNTRNITYQNILIAESKTGSLFGDSNAPNSSDMSFLNSLFFNVSHRHPNSASDGQIEIINNVIHQWQYRLGVMLFDIKLNHINNYHSMGLKESIVTRSGARNVNQADTERNQQIYTAGNIIDKGIFEDPDADNKPVFWVERQRDGGGPVAPTRLFVDTMHPLLGAKVPIKTAKEKIEEIRTNPDVGANASLNANGSVTYHTDAHDTFYLGIMAEGEGAGHPYLMQNKERSWTLEPLYKTFFRVSDSGDPLDYADDVFEGVELSVINTVSAK